MKTAKTKLSKITQATYILAWENDSYSLICIEESITNGTVEIYKASSLTKSKALANKIFKKIVKGKVFGVTLLDVIYNLIA